jgi:hypothetical protein
MVKDLVEVEAGTWRNHDRSGESKYFSKRARYGCSSALQSRCLTALYTVASSFVKKN